MRDVRFWVHERSFHAWEGKPMILIRKTMYDTLVTLDHLEPDSWINLVNPSEEEVQRIALLQGVPLDFLVDPLDADERARLEVEDGVILLVLRVPVENTADPRVPYITMPIGVIITSTAVITVCRAQQDLVSEILNGRARQVDTSRRLRFAITLMQRSALAYLRCLKDINRRSDTIEQALQESMRNQELIDLLGIEKSLVYFTTSLKANDIIMDKVLRLRAVQLSEEEVDLLEDAITENRQAIGMANIYSDILSGTMDAFASIISNNMNMVMKFLAGFTIILMIPNIISGIYGMNIELPMQDWPHAFAVLSVLALGGVAVTWWWFARKRWL